MPSSQLLVEPTWHTCPEYSWTLGPEVSELVALASDDRGPYVMDPEQDLLLDDWFGFTRRGKPAAFEAAVVAARQNLKTGALKAAALGKIFILEQRLVMWTAHQVYAAQEAQRDLLNLIDSSDYLRREFVRPLTGAGFKSLEFRNDRRIIFKARTGASAQSLTGDTVIEDEGFALTMDQQAALLPIMMARPGPQVLIGSSAGMRSSAVLRSLRNRGRTGAPRVSYAEWAASWRPCESEACLHAPETPGCALDDRALWRQANIAVARGRIDLDTISGVRQAMAADPAKFAREVLVWWEDPAEEGDAPIGSDLWLELADLTTGIEDPVFVLDVSPRSTMACIVVAGVAGDGLPVAEITGRGGQLDYRPGVAWVVPRLKELEARWPGFVLNVVAGSAAEALVPAIRNAGVDVEVLPAADYARACVWVESQARAKAFHHTGQEALGKAVAGMRPVGRDDKGTFVWGRALPTVDITPGVGMTAALWVAQSAADGGGPNIW